MPTIPIKLDVEKSPIIFPRTATALLAFILVVFSLPPLAARLMALEGDSIKQTLMESEKLTPDMLSSLDQNRGRTLRFFKRAELYNDRALAAFEHARLATAGKAPPQEIVRLYQEAEKWQIFALRRAPADPFGWYRLAYIYYLKQGASQAVARLWHLSMLTGPYETQLSVPRLQLGIALGALLGPQGDALIARLAQDAFRDFPYGLPDLAVQGYFVSVIENALQNDPPALALFRERVAAR